MTPARILLLVVALVAGGLAAFLATRGDRPATPQTIVTTEVVPEARTQILVAKSPIGVGDRLTSTTLEWQDWPEGAVRPEYVTRAAMPDALAQMSGTVARFEFFEGEPIRAEKIVRSDQGYLSAVLAEGMRGVSIEVQAASGAGGFIVPNDHVDVVLTRTTPSGKVSETILANVRILAIGKRLGEINTEATDEENADGTTTSRVFDDKAIATLELSPLQGETLINAASVGDLSLALRSVVDFKDVVTPNDRQSSAAIRLIRYGKEFAVLSTNSAQYASEDAAGTVDDQAMNEITVAPTPEVIGSPDPAVELQ